MDIARLQAQLTEQNATLPPVEQWNPPFCGDIDMCIRRDGSWTYMGTPIGRHALVKLFASVLRKDQEKYVLVTPVEKVGIQVEDTPFVITQWQQVNDKVVFTTNTDDTFEVDESHPFELRDDSINDGQIPYVNVRRNLWARLHQNVFYQMVDMAQHETQGTRHKVFITSGNYCLNLGSYVE